MRFWLASRRLLVDRGLNDACKGNGTGKVSVSSIVASQACQIASASSITTCKDGVRMIMFFDAVDTAGTGKDNISKRPILTNQMCLHPPRSGWTAILYQFGQLFPELRAMPSLLPVV